jgi:hypothetical protein
MSSIARFILLAMAVAHVVAAKPIKEKNAYWIPKVIQNLAPVPSKETKGRRIEVLLKAVTGSIVISNFRYIKAPELEITRFAEAPTHLREGEEIRIWFDVRAKQPFGKMPAPGPWVGVNFDYVPDWEALEKYAQDTERFPIAAERNKLLRKIQAIKSEKGVLREEALHYFSPN